MGVRSGSAGIALVYAVFAAVWIVASDALLNLLPLDAVAQSRVEIGKGMAFVAITALLLYSILNARRQIAGLPIQALHRIPGGVELRRLALLFGVLALSVPLIGFAIYTVQARQDEQAGFEDLKIIANAKAGQLESWLTERRSDAALFMASPGFIERVSTVQRTGNMRDLSFVRERLAAVRQTYAYEAIDLLDAQGALLLSVGDSPGAGNAVKATVATAIANGTIGISEFHRNAKGNINLAIVAPLYDSSDRRDPVATILLFVDPGRFLFPLIQAWPSADSSGETLLVRRSGDSVTYLNPLHHRSNAALSLRHGLTEPVLGAVVASSGSIEGTLRAKDYRGVDTLAAHRQVSGTDWHLIAKLDRAEATQGAVAAALWAGAVAALAGILVAIASLLLIRQQSEFRQLALQIQADNLLKQFYDLPFIGMAVTSATTHARVSFNDRLCQIMGYSREEFASKTWQEITHAEDVGRETAEYRRLLRGEADGFAMEKRFVRKDGSIVFAMVDVKCVRAPDGSVIYYLAMVQDVTRRRAAEENLRESEERYRLVVENSRDAILLTDPAGRVLTANPAACRMFGRSEEELRQSRRGDIADLSDPRIPLAVEQREQTGMFNGEMTLLRKDGSRFPAEVSTAVFKDIHGNTRSSMIIRDVSDRKLAEEEAKRHLARVQAALMHTVEVATTLSEMRDPYTAGHEKRVAQIAVAIAREMGFDEGNLEGLQIAGYLHDIGKITIPSEILSKPGRLSAAEFELVKGHAQASYEVLKNVEFPWPVADMVHQHHERIDGSGYPRGLTGAQMLPGARVLAVADVVEAMASHRPYRPGLGIEVALSEIERGRGRAFDPDVVDACLRLFREKGFTLPQ